MHDLPSDAQSALVFDLQEVGRLYREWTLAFPGIRPYYAMKCNPDPVVMRELHRLGAGFDCASQQELRAVFDDVGAKPGDVIYANTCKLAADIVYADGRVAMTVDNVEEVQKIQRCQWAKATAATATDIILRIHSANSDAIIPFGDKFGAMEHEWPAILDEIAAAPTSHPMNVRGVSFHVGSGCSNPEAYVRSIQSAYKCLRLMRDRGLSPDLLDIGGGFSSPIAPAVSEAILGVLKPELSSGLSVIAEPGRYFVETACTLYARVIGKRRRQDDACAYWINESIYGCFADVVHGYLTPEPHACDNDNQRPLKSTLYGSTCDGGDIIVKDAVLPEMNVGDWVEFPNMGAYTISLSTDFNGMGFNKIRRIYIA